MYVALTVFFEELKMAYCCLLYRIHKDHHFEPMLLFASFHFQKELACVFWQRQTFFSWHIENDCVTFGCISLYIS